MKESVMKVKDWWQNLDLREKRALTVGGMVSGFFILWHFFWAPSLAHVSDLRDRLVSSQKLLVWMEQASQKLQANKSADEEKTVNVSPMMLLNQIKKQINQAGLEQYISQLKQAGNETVQIQFKKIDFNSLVKLIGTLDKTLHVTVTRLSVIALSTPGYVNADVSIT